GFLALLQGKQALHDLDPKTSSVQHVKERYGNSEDTKIIILSGIPPTGCHYLLPPARGRYRMVFNLPISAIRFSASVVAASCVEIFSRSANAKMSRQVS